MQVTILKGASPLFYTPSPKLAYVVAASFWLDSGHPLRGLGLFLGVLHRGEPVLEVGDVGVHCLVTVEITSFLHCKVTVLPCVVHK